MFRCSADLRYLGAVAGDPDDAAQRVVSYLFDHLLVAERGGPACVLVRLFRTTTLSTLPAGVRAELMARLGDRANPETTCLALLASRGVLPEWNDPKRS